MSCFISICIPAYKRVHYLRRLLDSIAGQTYDNYEVIITDDSGDDNAVADLAAEYRTKLPVIYHHNTPALGTPRNWLAGISMATGTWIKLIHDDDWLSDSSSLATFAQAAEHNDAKLIFSGYTVYHEEDGRKEDKTISQEDFQRINKNPYLLFAQNRIGPPSVLMFHRSIQEGYDPALKWYVDLEYYIRVLKQQVKAIYINKPLIYVSYNETQVTQSCLNNPAVEVPEALHLQQRYGNRPARTLIIYDAWWRLLRNCGIRHSEDLRLYSKHYPVPLFVSRIVSHQRLLPLSALRIGLISKLAMTVSYVLNRRFIK